MPRRRGISEIFSFSTEIQSNLYPPNFLENALESAIAEAAQQMFQIAVYGDIEATIPSRARALVALPPDTRLHQPDWSDEPEWNYEISRSGDRISFNILTNSDVWFFLNDGFDGFVIRPGYSEGVDVGVSYRGKYYDQEPEKRRMKAIVDAVYVPLTNPNTFTLRRPYGYLDGEEAFIKAANHPGVEPRRWDERLTIALSGSEIWSSLLLSSLDDKFRQVNGFLA